MQEPVTSLAVKTAAVLLVAILFLSFALAVDFALSRLLPEGVNEPDAQLGWRLKRNLNHRRDKVALSGRKYQVAFSTNEFGLRTFGADRRAPIKILVLGDSHTGEPYASDDQMWYAEFVRRLASLTQRPLSDFYVLAGGSGGYGTLQNLLLARRLKDVFSPTLFVHQFCDNDFLNNSFELEEKSIAFNQWMLRPYLGRDRESIVRHTGLLAQAYRFGLLKSRLFASFDGLLQAQISKLNHGGGLMLPEQERRAYFQKARAILYDGESIRTTALLLKRLRDVYREIPAIMIDCPVERSSESNRWIEAGAQAGFVTIASPSDDLVALKEAGEDDFFNVDGDHLSDRGNEAMGRRLAEAVASLGIVPGR
jgi:hypothetical protein